MGRGKYISYGNKLDTLARQKFSNYNKAKADFEEAKRARFETPMRSGLGVTPEYTLKAKKTEIEYLEAEKKWREAQQEYNDTLNEVESIRAELVADVKAELTVNPEELDRNVVDLLTSGICSAEEISQLYEKAETPTTKRYIVKYAEGEAKRINESKLDVHEKRAKGEILNNIISSGKALTDPEKAEPVQLFDSVAGVLTRCINNPSMASYWGQLTEEALSEL